MKRVFTPLLAVAALCSNAQFTPTTTVTGSGTNASPWVLAADASMQVGGVWKTAAVNLANNFTLTADLNFGTRVEAGNGADGIAFVMLNGANYSSVTPTTIGAAGGGMGYVGLQNSLAFEMDTWENHEQHYDVYGNATIYYDFNDPVPDHADFMVNGNPNHAATPTALNGEVEDGVWRTINISWNTTTKMLTINFNGQTFTKNFTTFGGNAYLGFTAATGISTNLHQLRNFAVTTSTPCNLQVSASVPSLGCSGGNTIFLGYGPTSVTATANQSGATFKWYNATNNALVANGATFTPSQAGSFYVVATKSSCTASTSGTANVIKVQDIRCSPGIFPHDNDDDSYNCGFNFLSSILACLQQYTQKVYVCHKPNGNGHRNEDPITLCVSVNAVAVHLAHGDCLGICPSDANNNNGNGRCNRTASTEEGATTAASTRTAASIIEKSIQEAAVTPVNVVAYPNPSHGTFKVSLQGIFENVDIQVVNSNGVVVSTLKSGGLSTVDVNLSRSGAGVYLIRVISGKSILKTAKVIVE